MEQSSADQIVPLNPHPTRFNDSSLLQFVETGPKSTSLETLYGGTVADDRMAALRPQIEFVRKNWDRYAEFNHDLHEYLKTSYQGNERDRFLQAVDKIFGKEKKWSETSPDYGVLFSYTSVFGYEHIFSSASRVFRAKTLIEDDKAARINVFLTELLNIDLFLYHAANAHVRNFSGTVFRGIALTKSEFQRFKDLSSNDIRDRVWAIPLSTMSASSDLQVARDFFLNNAANNPERNYLVLLRIHVESLDAKSLTVYQSHFPSSIVSSLCATPVKDIAELEQENEVLLRAPWFHLVSLREERLEDVNDPVHVMDVVMITSNRDHPSTMELEVQDYKLSRDLFKSLNWIVRCRKCETLANEFGLFDDARDFKKVMEQETENAERCLNQIKTGRGGEIIDS